MKIPVLIEVTENHRFRATGGVPLRIAALDLPGASHPWHRVFGMFQDDPPFDEWQQAISDNRRIVDDSEEGA